MYIGRIEIWYNPYWYFDRARWIPQRYDSRAARQIRCFFLCITIPRKGYYSIVFRKGENKYFPFIRSLIYHAFKRKR